MWKASGTRNGRMTLAWMLQRVRWPVLVTLFNRNVLMICKIWWSWNAVRAIGWTVEPQNYPPSVHVPHVYETSQILVTFYSRQFRPTDFDVRSSPRGQCSYFSTKKMVFKKCGHCATWQAMLIPIFVLLIRIYWLVGGDWNHGILWLFPETVGNGIGRAQPPTRFVSGSCICHRNQSLNRTKAMGAGELFSMWYHWWTQLEGHQVCEGDDSWFLFLVFWGISVFFPNIWSVLFFFKVFVNQKPPIYSTTAEGFHPWPVVELRKEIIEREQIAAASPIEQRWTSRISWPLPMWKKNR